MPRIRRHLFLNSEAFQNLGQRVPLASSFSTRFTPYPLHPSVCHHSLTHTTSEAIATEEPTSNLSGIPVCSLYHIPSAGLGPEGRHQSVGTRCGGGRVVAGRDELFSHLPPLGFQCSDCGRHFGTRDELAMHSLERVQREFFCRHPDAYPDSNPDALVQRETREDAELEDLLSDGRNRSPVNETDSLLENEHSYDDVHLNGPSVAAHSTVSVSVIRPKSECIEGPEEVAHRNNQTDSERVRHPSLVAAGTSSMSSSKNLPASVDRTESANEVKASTPSCAGFCVRGARGGPPSASEATNSFPLALQNLLAAFQNIATLQRLAPLPHTPPMLSARYPLLGPYFRMPHPANFASHPLLRPAGLAPALSALGGSLPLRLADTANLTSPEHEIQAAAANSSSSATASMNQPIATSSASSGSSSASSPQLIPFFVSGSPLPAYFVPNGGAEDSFLCLQCTPPARVSRFSHFLEHMSGVVPTSAKSPQSLDRDGEEAVAAPVSSLQIPSRCLITSKLDETLFTDERLDRTSAERNPDIQIHPLERPNTASTDRDLGAEKEREGVKEEAEGDLQNLPAFVGEGTALETASVKMDGAEGEDEDCGLEKEFPFVCSHCRIAFADKLLFQLHAGYGIHP